MGFAALNPSYGALSAADEPLFHRAPLAVSPDLGRGKPELGEHLVGVLGEFRGAPRQHARGAAQPEGLPLQGERTPQVLFKQRSVANGKVSPSGKWIAYESAESGRTEIYVRKFSAGAEKWQVSTEGGDHALWSRDGSELYFRSSGPKGAMVMSTRVGKGEEFTFSPPRALFRFAFA